MNKPCLKLTKTIQKRIYDFLLTKFGAFILCISLVAIVLAVIHLSETLVEYRLEHLKQLSDSFRNFKWKLLDSDDTSSDRHVDAVYTWVNGSDPAHLENLYQIKKKSHTTNTSYSKVELDAYLSKLTNETQQLWPCYHKLCIQTNNIIVISPKLNQADSKRFSKEINKLFDSNFTLEAFDNLSLLMITRKLDSIDLDKLNNLFKASLSGDYKLYMGFYTIDPNCNLANNCIKNLEKTFIIRKIKSKTIRNNNPLNNAHNRLLNAPREEASNEMELPSSFNDNLVYKLDYIHVPPKIYDGSQTSESNVKKFVKEAENLAHSPMATHLSVIKVKTNQLDDYLSACSNSNLNQTRNLFQFVSSKNNKNISYDIYKANIAYDLGDPIAEDFAENRFQDNDELKYSLRSLDKYAPWIRNVYLVTNGQIPNWLNLSHPKIRLVNHKEIFLNKSHLPTFSSPAIESHLHRIKGLSSKFIYFNDDYLLAKPIYFDDFYTESKGFKIHLAWSLPGCNTNCPNSWIRDGYCDKACNNSDCDFDGGDCDPSKIRVNQYDSARLHLMNQTQLVYPDFYCAPGCSTTWLADKYCDNACNVYSCGFDMGDCGCTNIYPQMYGATLNSQEVDHLVRIPQNTLVFYLNLTANDYKATSASYSDHKSVRLVSFVNKYKLLTVLLFQSALNNTKSDFFKIDLTLSNKTNEYNMTINIELNSLDATRAATTTPLSHLTKLVSTSKKTKIKKINLDNLEPVKSGINIDFLPQNISNIYPKNFKHSNDYLNEVYESYFNYLNWSLTNGYLSDLGFRYKLFLFYSKLTNEINETYSGLKNDFAGKNLNETNSFLNEIIFNILFNSNRTKILSDYDRRVLVDRFLNETNASSNRILSKIVNTRRHKRDTFADSLRYVNKLFNQIYGYMARKVPAHIPHLIDREIMSQLQLKFSKQFDETSSHKLRSSNDMQYAFSYYYFLMSELEEFNASKLFTEIDINENNLLDDTEIMIINLKLSTRPFSSSNIGSPVADMFTLNSDLTSHVNECKANQSVDGLISRDQFLLCENFIAFLKDKLWSSDLKNAQARNKYKYEAVGDEDTKFVMVAGDPLEIEIKLNNIIRDPIKFVCLNDNIDYKIKHEANELKRLMKHFYNSLFPLASSFEKKLLSSNNRISNDTYLSLNFYYFNYQLVFLVLILIIVSYFLFKCLKNLLFKKKFSYYSPSDEVLKNI